MRASADELIERGRAARRAGNKVEAAEIYELAAVELEGMGDAKRSMHALRHAAELRLDLGAVAEAQSDILRVLEVYRERDTDELEMANAVRTAALVQEAAGLFADARALWVEARGLYEFLEITAGVDEADRRLAGLTVD